MTESKRTSKTKIVKLIDGKVLTWTEALDKRLDKACGYREVFEDGTIIDTMDSVNYMELSKPNNKKEEYLMKENEKLVREITVLRRRLEVATRVTISTPNKASNTPPVPNKASNTPPVNDPMETIPIAGEEEEATSVLNSNPVLVIDEITSWKSASELGRKRKELLITYAHRLSPGIDLKDSATKKDLAKICFELQGKRK